MADEVAIPTTDEFRKIVEHYFDTAPDTRDPDVLEDHFIVLSERYNAIFQQKLKEIRSEMMKCD